MNRTILDLHILQTVPPSNLNPGILPLGLS